MVILSEIYFSIYFYIFVVLLFLQIGLNNHEEYL